MRRTRITPYYTGDKDRLEHRGHSLPALSSDRLQDEAQMLTQCRHLSKVANAIGKNAGDTQAKINEWKEHICQVFACW